MSKIFRIALAWLLAVALPIQGYAAQTMLSCGPAHHQSVATHEDALHDHGDDATHADPQATSLHDDASSATSDGVQDHHAKTFRSGHSGKCSACASCCGAAAIATAILSIAVVPQHSSVVSTIPVGHAHDFLGGLDRPPRQILA